MTYENDQRHRNDPQKPSSAKRSCLKNLHNVERNQCFYFLERFEETHLDGYGETIYTDTMHERKAKMAETVRLFVFWYLNRRLFGKWPKLYVSFILRFSGSLEKFQN